MKKLLFQLVSLFIVVLALNAKAEDDSYEESFSQAELEQMLAPIALYPDSILTHVLIASTYPLEVISADRWVKQHPDKDAADALDMVEDKDWDPSVKALVPFPRLLERMSNNLEWTQKLGDAFLQDEAAVLDAIQVLRSRAEQAGNLEKMEHMEVSREDDKIIIQPVKREIVYVPYYDTRYVYGHWYWDSYPPIYWDWHWSNHYRYSHHRPFYWHPRVHIGYNFFWSAFHWHNHQVIIINRNHYHERRHYHRRDILTHTHARRWSHNPSHRRGVAYRNQTTRVRYSSTRPSYIESKTVRASETQIVKRTKSENRNTLSRNTGKDGQTRQQQLRSRLNQRETSSRDRKNRNTQTRENASRENFSRSNQSRGNTSSQQSRERKEHSTDRRVNNRDVKVNNGSNSRRESSQSRSQNTRSTNEHRSRDNSQRQSKQRSRDDSGRRSDERLSSYSRLPKKSESNTQRANTSTYKQVKSARSETTHSYSKPKQSSNNSYRENRSSKSNTSRSDSSRSRSETRSSSRRRDN